jgi:hypothetical protein
MIVPSKAFDEIWRMLSGASIGRNERAKNDHRRGLRTLFRGRPQRALIFRQRRVPKGFPTDLARVARRKLVQLNNATMLGDLVAPPGNPTGSFARGPRRQAFDPSKRSVADRIPVEQ